MLLQFYDGRHRIESLYGWLGDYLNDHLLAFAIISLPLSCRQLPNLVIRKGFDLY